MRLRRAIPAAAVGRLVAGPGSRLRLTAAGTGSGTASLSRSSASAYLAAKPDHRGRADRGAGARPLSAYPAERLGGAYLHPARADAVSVGLQPTTTGRYHSVSPGSY